MNNPTTTPSPSEIIKKTLNDEDQIEESERQLSLKKDEFVVDSDYQSKQAKTLPDVDALKVTSPTHQKEEESMALVEEESGRERLKRHRVEMAGRVWIPDLWGQEDLLKDWIDCNAFDASLVNNSIMSARAALMQERTGTAASSSVLRIENRC